MLYRCLSSEKIYAWSILVKIDKQTKISRDLLTDVRDRVLKVKVKVVVMVRNRVRYGEIQRQKA